jgi:PKD repeat protein
LTGQPLQAFSFDFGTTTSPVMPGWIGVSNEPYSPDRGYGWTGQTPPLAMDFQRRGANALSRDFHLGSSNLGCENTFVIDLPNGSYDVTASLGTEFRPLVGGEIWANGEPAVIGLNTDYGQQAKPTFQARVTGGRLDLCFKTTGDWIFITDLQIVPVETSELLSAFAGGPYTAVEGSPVNLIASATGGTGELSYAWDLDGDGAFETPGPEITFAFADDGEYEAMIRVTDSLGQIALATAMISVANSDPTATITSPGQAIVGDEVRFQPFVVDPGRLDEAAGFAYQWDFGDGTTSRERSPDHAFAAAGVYLVGLTVTDKDGGVGQTIATVEVVSSALASIGLTPGWATFGQTLPEGAAFDGLQVGGLVTQTDVKTTWADGSIKFAVVSASVPTAGTYPVTEGAPRQGSFAAELPDAEVRLDVGGVPYTAALPDGPSADAWLSGPLVHEGRHEITPVTDDGTPHPFLRVIYDVRSYADGASRLDVTVDNTLNLAGAGMETYDVAIVAEGQTLFERQAVDHHYLTRWRKTFGIDLTESEFAPDFEPLHEAGAVPRYRTDIENVVDDPTGPDFEILRPGSTPKGMGQPGEGPSIGLLPWWVPRYIVHKDPTQLEAILANGDLAGSWPIHLTMEDGNPVNIDQRLKFWFDPRGSEKPLGDLTRTSDLVPSLSHTPSLAYVPYLLTGDRYYADEMRSWAAWGVAALWEFKRGPNALIQPSALQIRSTAWQLRNWAEAAAYLPDNDTFRDYFASKVQGNLEWLDSEATTNLSPLGSFIESNVNSRTKRNVSVWQYGYLNWSIEHINDLGIPGVSGGRDTQRQMAAFTLQFYNSPQFPRENAVDLRNGSGWIDLAHVDENGNLQYFEDLASLYAYNFPEPRPLSVNYAPHHLGLLHVAMRHDVGGADDAYDWLASQPRTQFLVARRSGMAIVLE